MKRFILALFSITLLVLAACSPGSLPGGTPLPATDVPPPPITVEDFPRLDGSTSAEPVMAMIACHFLEGHCTWVDWLDGERRLVPELSNPSGEFPGVFASGTHQAYVNLIDGLADLILVARAPSQDEFDLARISGVQLDVLPVALDAFVFIVNEDNPIEGLTSAQIRAIYTGELTGWSGVGGMQGEIHPYQRNDNSGSQELMLELVMKGRKMVDAPEMMMLWSMFAPFNAITDDLLGIGYSVFYYEENMAPQVERVKLIAVDGVLPDGESIREREYPYTTEVYAVMRKDLAKDSLAYQLHDWLLSSDGQALIAESGYVPIE